MRICLYLFYSPKKFKCYAQMVPTKSKSKFSCKNYHKSVEEFEITFTNSKPSNSPNVYIIFLFLNNTLVT